MTNSSSIQYLLEQIGGAKEREPRVSAPHPEIAQTYTEIQVPPELLEAGVVAHQEIPRVSDEVKDLGVVATEHRPLHSVPTEVKGLRFSIEQLLEHLGLRKKDPSRSITWGVHRDKRLLEKEGYTVDHKGGRVVKKAA